MKIATVVGARPQFIKAGPLSRAIRSAHEERWIHTGQHYDEAMSGVFFRELGLPEPDYRLEVGSAPHGAQTGRMLEGIESILKDDKPDAVLVYGDTNSTLAGSLAAAKLSIPVVHVESGLRSFNKAMPEEINRVLTDHLSAVLFCPTDVAVTNLKREGIDNRVHLVGDIMYDAVLEYSARAKEHSDVLERVGLAPGSYCLATIHRAENTDSAANMTNILEAFGKLDRLVLLPLHPRTLGYIRRWGLESMLGHPNLITCAPLSYLNMLRATSEAFAVLTDSGGLQKEAYMLKVPCLTIRRETEWIETVQAGWNRLAEANAHAIISEYGKLGKPRRHPRLFGDGRAAARMVQVMERYFSKS
ncbi:UDP-N-acetylglucosamine 2-epimerase (non-hydrolyzing) [Paenibacillus sp. LHD-117]|uniref:non-hydrolyzing UDP-N-acetylglucosamine 2-epimerase n=1 Tax=Paenibacillus sp. LHD-117 TaxID=3071412 RepID=UPI0027E0866D|nr:UDP-N-acetylglucosamine 2-epimerase (non-hydrolyzing) [Paenibacillus sp. LHD-117]MDQ6418334.1 UDP-N-acetylglucosamine 2-epimerase (non-hydrolyzing) [Paenibacillus sp. LHD-117]